MSDIRGTLEVVRKRLNEYFKNADPLREDWVVLSNLVDPQGQPFEGAKNRLVMFLVNITRENTISTYNPNVPVEGGGYAVVAAPQYIDLYVFFFANFYDERYADGLAAISTTISFFQQNPVFTPADLPGLEAQVGKLTFEFTNLNPVDLSYLLGLTGTKYLPSVLYKVRRLPFQAGAIDAEASAVHGLEAPGEPKEEGVNRPTGPSARRAGRVR